MIFLGLTCVSLSIGCPSTTCPPSRRPWNVELIFLAQPSHRSWTRWRVRSHHLPLTGRTSSPPASRAWLTPTEWTRIVRWADFSLINVVQSKDGRHFELLNGFRPSLAIFEFGDSTKLARFVSERRSNFASKQNSLAYYQVAKIENCHTVLGLFPKKHQGRIFI